MVLSDGHGLQFTEDACGGLNAMQCVAQGI
jgi:hypothetical protein